MGNELRPFRPGQKMPKWKDNLIRDHVRETFRRGLDDSKQVIGWHGTSIQTMKFACEHGFLPVGNPIIARGEHYGIEDYGVYLFPNMSHSYNQLLNFREPTTHGVELAKNAAATLGRLHHIAEALNIPLDDPRYAFVHEATWMRLVDPKNAAENGYLPKDARRALKESDRFSGFTLAISEEVLSRFKVLTGEDGDDIKVVLKEGLPLQFVFGIEPHGQVEWDWIQKQ
jgi:hypothetical protein